MLYLRVTVPQKIKDMIANQCAMKRFGEPEGKRRDFFNDKC